MQNGSFTILGKDADGTIVCRDEMTGDIYNCGLTPEEFGLDDLTEEEKKLLGVTTS